MVTYNKLYYTDSSYKICANVSIKSVKETSLHPNTKTIVANAFESCNKLENIEFNNGLQTIYQKAFFGCTELKAADLSKTKIAKIDKVVFNGCTSLEKVKLPSTVISICESAFNECKSLEKITLPKNVEYIYDNAFANTSLKKIKLPKTLKVLGNKVFSNTQITDIFLPESLETVGDFLENSKIENIYYKKLSPEVYSMVSMLSKKYKINLVQEDDLDYLLTKKHSFKEINSAYNKGIDR